MTLRVVLLAAGFGTRMYPLTEQTAKPLLEVGGRPVLSRVLDRVAAIPGVSQVVVVSNGRFYDDLRQWAREQDAPVPLSILNSGATAPDDRRGAVADLAAAMATSESDGRWLIMAGDNLLDHPLASYVAHVGDGNAVLCRDLGSNVPPSMFGEITTDDAGLIVGFREKPPDPKSPLAATCTYLLDSRAPEFVQQFLSQGGNPDAPGEFVAWLAQQVDVRALPIEGPYFDIGSLQALDAARRAFG